ncbi:DUF1090 family protein [Arsenophonus nasoniae]|uniref:DUF1090 family protein n=1 Tax=Arsenophonus nasoniae TaxID=638 RepID=UPI0038799201
MDFMNKLLLSFILSSMFTSNATAGIQSCKEQKKDIESKLAIAKENKNIAAQNRLQLALHKVNIYCTEERQTNRAKSNLNKKEQKVKDKEWDVEQAKHDLAEARLEGRQDKIRKKERKLKKNMLELENAKDEFKNAKDDHKKLSNDLPYKN